MIFFIDSSNELFVQNDHINKSTNLFWSENRSSFTKKRIHISLWILKSISFSDLIFENEILSIDKLAIKETNQN